MIKDMKNGNYLLEIDARDVCGETYLIEFNESMMHSLTAGYDKASGCITIYYNGMVIHMAYVKDHMFSDRLFESTKRFCEMAFDYIVKNGQEYFKGE